MTDRIQGFTVALERDMREDDAEVIRAAILALRGVVDVQAIGVASTTFIERSRLRTELANGIMDLLGVRSNDR